MSTEPGKPSDPGKSVWDKAAYVYLPIGVGVGIVFGAALGIFLDNIALGVGIGMALGCALGAVPMAFADQSGTPEAPTDEPPLTPGSESRPDR